MSEGRKTFDQLLEELRVEDPQWADFVEHLVSNGFNRGAAAAAAGYAESSKYVQGGRLIRNDKISVVLDAYWREQHMSSDELLGLIAQDARSDLANFITFDDEGRPRIDLSSESARHALHQVKEIDFTEERLKDEGDDDYVVLSQRIKIKLKDPNPSRQMLAKHKGLLTDKLQIEDGPERAKRTTEERRQEREWLERVIAQRKAAEEEE